MLTKTQNCVHEADSRVVIMLKGWARFTYDFKTIEVEGPSEVPAVTPWP